MILLDPDLDPDPRQHFKASRRAARGRSRVLPWAERLPTPRTLSRFLAVAQAAVGLRGEVSVLLTTDRAIRRLNRQFRGKDKATDVLSFPASALASGPEKAAGDLAISVDTSRRQGTACGHSLGVELKVLMLHGLLHLAGYDHEADNGRMARCERQLRARFALPLGLIERAGTTADPSTRSLRELAQDDTARSSARAGASQREATKIAQGEVRASEGNPGNARPKRARRPVGPARTLAPTRSRPQ